MGRNGRNMAGAVLALGLLAASAAAAAEAALAGTWTLVAADDLHPDGHRTPGYGADPQGRLIIDGQGRYSLQIFKAERPKFAAGDKRKGAPAEYESAVLGSSTHFGTIAADPAHGVLTFRIARASFPNWEGTTQTRQYQLTDDTLSYKVPAAPDGTVPISVWRRAP
ncbi:MAG: lipocalin-like domain protein [Caulobacter sp.]|nr:lipocalin-like domain protein [Caulobacter sp.]